MLTFCFFASSVEAERIEIKIAAKDVPENHFDLHCFSPDNYRMSFKVVSLVVPSFEEWMRRELNLQVYDKIISIYTERELKEVVDSESMNRTIMNYIKYIVVRIDIETID